jgi:radical SAM protein with 4Fe4S-binding SPASM domain
MNEQTFYGFREKGETTRYQGFALELVAPSRCQLRCRNCYKSEDLRRSRDGEMPTEFAKEALDQARANGFAEAIFMGGEPTLHSDLAGLVEYAISIELAPIVVTNGMKLSDTTYANRIAQPGATLVLHAPLPEHVQDKEVQTRGYSKKLRQAYVNLARRKDITVVAEVVAIREFLPHIPEMVEWCRENSIVPFVEFNRTSDKGIIYEGTISPEEVKDLFDKIRANDPNPAEIFLPPAYAQPCTMAITGVHVKNFGNGDFGGVYSCCAQSVRHGDLRSQTLAEILGDSSFLVFKNQDEWIFGPCRECEYYSICRGGCRGQAYQTFGCARASSPFCWHLSAEVRSDYRIMAPPSCHGCPLKGNPACRPQR